MHLLAAKARFCDPKLADVCIVSQTLAAKTRTCKENMIMSALSYRQRLKIAMRIQKMCVLGIFMPIKTQVLGRFEWFIITRAVLVLD